MTNREPVKYGYTVLGVGIALSTVGMAAPGLAQAPSELDSISLNGENIPVLEDMPIQIDTSIVDGPGTTYPETSTDGRYRFSRVLPGRAFMPNIAAPSTTPITDQYGSNLREWSNQVRTCMRARPQLYRMAEVVDTESRSARTRPLRVAIPIVIDGDRGSIQADQNGNPVCPG